MKAPWPIVPLGQAIRHRKEFIAIDDLTEYKRCRVQLHAKGIVLRDIVSGAAIRTKQQQVCRAGEFLVAEIDAKVGGFGIVPDELEGAIVSSHYFLYEIDEPRLERRFLDYYIRTRAFRDQVEAQGSTNYAAIRPQQVLDYTLPLPPLAEQQRIVAHIDALAARIEEAKELRAQAVEEAERLFTIAAKWVRIETLKHFPRSPIGQVATVTSGGTPSRGNPEYWNGEIPWIKTGELVDGDLYGSEERITELGLSESSARLFPPGTILVALYGQGQTRGRTGRLMIPATTNQACCAILPSPDHFEARFTQYWLRSLYYDMRAVSRDGAQPNWNGQMIKKIEIALPPIHEQRRIVAYLDDLQAKVDAVKGLQADTQAELDALLPSVLDRAFRGEL